MQAVKQTSHLIAVLVAENQLKPVYFGSSSTSKMWRHINFLPSGSSFRPLYADKRLLSDLITAIIARREKDTQLVRRTKGLAEL